MAKHDSFPAGFARIPSSTYRLQLTHRFGFADAEAVVPYLAELGVSDLYCSPILKARSGSEHCYDVVDPTLINPELGGEIAFKNLAQRLKAHGMGLLLDIVPNHMAVSPENLAWMNVLEYGPASPFADWFDIEWHAAAKPGAVETGVLLPILGKQLDTAIAEGEVALQLEGGRFVVRYYDWSFPVNARSMSLILQRVRVKVPAGGMGDHRHAEPQQLEELASRIEQLPPWQEASGAVYRQACDDVKRQLAAMLERDADLRARIDAGIAEINATVGALDELLDRQVYRLRHWRSAASELTYRRFFDITDLIGVRVEHPHVFQQTHKLVLHLLQLGEITGLRIDHIDGLADPATYLNMLQDAIGQLLGERHIGSASQRAFVLVEKILEAGETLNEHWPISGATGYEFLNAVNELFINPQGLAALGEHHAVLTGQDEPFAQVVRGQKARMARELFGGEVNALVQELQVIANGFHGSPSRDSRDAQDSRLGEPRYHPEPIRDALIAISAELPVYRTYADGGTFSPRDRDLLQGTFDRLMPTPEVDLLHRILLGDSRSMTGEQREACKRFITRWQQFTGPLMAKGLEDTSLYQDARLISLNEVGMDPQSLGQPRGVEQFHEHMQQRAHRWRGSMNATSTHDTKRGEDMRARINVLSELAEEWIETVERWMALNSRYRATHRGVPVPDARMELFLYQTALGMWPLTSHEQEQARERLEQYALKAAREAKTHTGWLEPDETYERLLQAFVREAFNPARDDAFMADFRSLHSRIAWFGAMNSLSQLLMKLTAPGVPDLYQGCELWDLSLVDPDNRRPVDFEIRRQHLSQLRQRPVDELLPDIMHNWRDGRIKMLLIQRALHARSSRHEVFSRGEYIPMNTGGERARNLCAFARRYNDQWTLVIAPLRLVGLADEGVLPTGAKVWGDAILHLPASAPQRWMNLLTERPVESRQFDGEHRMIVGEALRDFPCALLAGAL